MNRCLLAFWIATPLLAIAASATAQTTLPSAPLQAPLAQAGHRTFPHNAQRGVLRVTQIPNVKINGQAVRTAPGFRLLSADNKLIFADSLLNQDLQVMYVKEASTDWLLTAWILSPEEIATLNPKR